jgi:purine nucleosidase
MRTTGLALDTTAQEQLVALNAILPGLAPPDCIIALGPLTNLAQHLIPQWGPQIPVIWMGGSTDRGNHTAAAEFNALADPEAAALVFAGTQQMRMVGLNVCREVLLDCADVERFETLRSTQARVFAGHLAAYQRIRSADGARPMPLYDPVAVAAALHPEWFEFTPARVDVECAGHFTRGMTVCEFRLNASRTANALVATGLQAQPVKRWILDTTFSYLRRFEAHRHG